MKMQLKDYTPVLWALAGVAGALLMYWVFG